jgi:nucleotide-binding universal stress UspA family protein
MYASILVPLDGSPFSEHTLPLAQRVARRSGAVLRLVHVHEAAPYQARTAPPDAQQREDERAYLAGLAERMAAGWQGQVETALLDGPVAEAIAAQAGQFGSDLVIMSTHGRGALSRTWLGSTADRLIRSLPMPVLLLRPRQGTAADTGTPPEIRHILIPLDGSPLAESILPHAGMFGRLTDATYTLVQAIEIFMPDYGYGPYVPSDFEIDSWQDEAQSYLERIATGLRAEGREVKTDVILGPAGMSILEYAHKHAADLIALETHGRTGLARLFLGSVADKIVRGAGVPVLLHRPPDKAAAM